jgi:hypothetical protein
MAESAGAIVEHFDVIGDLGIGHLPCLVDSFLDPFLLQTAKEGFCHCVISAPAHTELQMKPGIESAARHVEEAAHHVPYQTLGDVL